MLTDAIAALDASGILAATTAALRRRRLGEVEELELLAHWALLNGEDPAAHPDPVHARNARLVGDRLTYPGGEGTPGLREFTLGEIAMARGCSDGATRWAIADVLDLIYRLPRVWTRVRAGECEPWLAKKVARMCRHLPAACVGDVDAAVARIIDREAASRVLTVAEAAIIAADPQLHEERRQAKLRSRYVDITRRTEDGSADVEPLDGVAILRARLDARDALWLEVTLKRLVEIITPEHPDAGPHERRAIALGLLGDPARALTLLAGSAVEDSEEPRPEQDPDARTLFGDLDDLLTALTAGTSRLRPKTVLYVHLHEAALLGRADGCARVEGLGPVSLAALADLLARTDLSVRPVIDLNGTVRSTSYEHPEALKERVFLSTGGEYWPYGTSTGRNGSEFDHVTRFLHPDPGQPPDPDTPPQTGTHNSGPLTKRHHRWKTFAGYRTRQAGPGRYALITPHGQGYLVDATGTRPLDPEKIRLIVDAEPGLDVYPTG